MLIPNFLWKLSKADPRLNMVFTFFASGAFFWVDISGILPYPDLKIAHKSFHFFRLALGEDVNEGVASNFFELRRQEGGCLLQIGKGSIQLTEMAIARLGRGTFQAMLSPVMRWSCGSPGGADAA